MTKRDQLTSLRRTCARINAETQAEAAYSGMERLYAAVDAIARLVDVLAEHAQQAPGGTDAAGSGSEARRW